MVPVKEPIRWSVEGSIEKIGTSLLPHNPGPNENEEMAQLLARENKIERPDGKCFGRRKLISKRQRRNVSATSRNQQCCMAPAVESKGPVVSQ